jgi:hypothetical protein
VLQSPRVCHLWFDVCRRKWAKIWTHESLRIFFAMVKIQGTPCMRRHISARPATIKYFSNSFVFKIKFEKEGLPRDDTPDLGAGGPRFKSGRPDQNILRIFFDLLKARFTQNPSVEFDQTGGQNSQAV